jgi:hypothetical protein
MVNERCAGGRICGKEAITFVMAGLDPVIHVFD